jgi:hypothetical protein
MGLNGGGQCFKVVVHLSPKAPGIFERTRTARRRGYIYDIKLRNIHIYADRMPPSSLDGYDEEHAVSDITVDGLFLGDRRITNLEEAWFSLGKHVRSVTIH